MNEFSENGQVSEQNLLPYFLSFAATALMIGLLYFQERLWWCKLSDYAIYVNEAWNSNHTSQHFFDPYTFTHVLHGVMFLWLASMIFSRFSVAWQFFIAIFVECAWEIMENSNFIIEKYRANTASLDYFGDSILNSVGDVVACAIGFFIAYKLGWLRSIIFFFVVEIFLVIWIKDSLIINILMLIYPLDSIKNWQINM